MVSQRKRHILHCKNLPQSRRPSAQCPAWKRPRKISALHLQAETTYQVNSQQGHRSVISPLTSPANCQTGPLANSTQQPEKAIS